MSSSEKMEDSPNDNVYSENVFQDQSEKFDRNPTRAVEENLPSVGELAFENQRLSSSRSVKVSCQLSNQPQTPSSQAGNIDQLDETFSSADVYSSRELRSVDALLSPRQNPTASSMSVLEDSDASGVKINQRNLSSFAAKLNPERGPVPVSKSLSKNLKETNTPSPEKRSVETDAGSTPIKRLRKTPESDSGKPEIETESYRSKLRLSAAAKTSCKSPTNLQIQQMKAAIQKNVESESLNTPSKRSKGKITRNRAVESKTANDPCLSNLISPSPAANIVNKSPTNLQMHGSNASVRNVDESPTGRKTLISFRDCSTDSNSLAKHSNPDDFLQIASFLSFPTKKHKSTALNESTDASSDYPSLKNIKQKDTQSTSDISDEGALPNFASKKVGTIMHPTTSTDTSLFRPNNVSGKQRNRLPVSDVSFEVAQPDLPVKETEPAVRLTDKTSSSNRGPVSKSQNSTTESFESCIEVKKRKKVKKSKNDSASISAKETQSTSNVADSAIETQILKSSQSSPIILNPHLPASCHLPRRSISSVTNAPRRILEFDTSDKKMRIDQNRLDSSTRTSTPERESRFQSKELSVLRSCEMHRRSLSDETLTSKNSPQLYQSNKLKGMFPRAHSKESSTSCSLGVHRRSVSDETLTSRNLTEVQTQQDQSNSLIRSQSKETPISRNLDGILERDSRTTCVVRPLFREMPPRSASNTTQATSNPLESSHSGRSNQLLLEATESLPSNESSTSRNNPEVQMQRNRKDSLLHERLLRFIMDEASTSRNQPEVVSDINPPYIDVFEGQASTSRYQPIVTGGSSSFDQSYFPTPRNEPAMRESEINFPNMRLFGRLSPTLRYRPIRTGGPASHDSSSDYSSSSSSDVSQPGEARERTRGTFEPSTPSRPDEHAEYTVEARFLLQSVLREMMLHNGEWKRFEASFRRISESCSEVDSDKLCYKLTRYLANRGYGLWSQNLFLAHEMTAETCVQVTYEKLLSTVVATLSFILRVAITRDFFAVMHYYWNFNSLRRQFLMYSAINDVEDIQDEVSRNRVKTLKKMIHSLLLRTLPAFRLLLMYIGEHCEEEFIKIWEHLVAKEDKMYLRRKY